MNAPSTYHKNLAVHMHYAQHTSALEMAKLSGWHERIVCFLIGMAAIVVPMLLVLWDQWP